MDERDFYNEKQEMKTATYSCPKCRQTSEFQIRWMRRSRKKELPRGASDLDRAKFATARDYMDRIDDMLFCPNPRCRANFELPYPQPFVSLCSVRAHHFTFSLREREGRNPSHRRCLSL